MTVKGWVVDEFGEIVKFSASPTMSELMLDVGPGQALVETVPPSNDARWNKTAGLWVVRPAKPSPFDEWNKAAQQWSDNRTLAQMKLDRWTYIKALRDAAMVAPFVTPAGTFDGNLAAINEIINYVQQQAAQSLPATVSVTMADNSTITLTQAQAVRAFQILLARNQAKRGAGVTAKSAIDAATTPAQVAAVVWPG